MRKRHLTSPKFVADEHNRRDFCALQVHKSGLTAKTICYYESVGLMPKVVRTSGGYRRYSETDIHALPFIRRARDLGFSVEQIDEPLTLWRNRRRSSAAVKALALARIAAPDAKAAQLTAINPILKYLVEHFSGDGRARSSIPDDVAWSSSQAFPSSTPRKKANGGKFG